MKDGLDEKEARYAARRKFGNVTLARERFYEAGRWLWFDEFVRDLRFAWRITYRRPLSALSIIALLALGMGCVTAVFNPLYSMLFTPLSFSQPEQLTRIGGDIRMFNLYTVRFEREDALGMIFSNIAAYTPLLSTNRIRVPETGRVKETYPLYVTEGLFGTLGVKPMIGYDFSSKEHQDGVIVSYRFWRDEMMQADDAIGNHIFIGLNPVTIVGIMPEKFNFPIDVDVWLCGNGSSNAWPIGDGMQLIGRLRQGISIGQAADTLKAIDFNPVPGIIGSGGPVLQPLQTFLYGDQTPLLKILGAVSILFLLLVCAGVMNILITRGAQRKAEMAQRLIFGATRKNLVFQLLLEMLPLVVIGGLAGWWLSKIINTWLVTYYPAFQSGNVVVPVKMAFGAALILLVTLITGLIPSLYATSLDLNTWLKSASDGKRRFLLSQEFLVGVQLSIALALLIGMGVMLRSMMHRVDFPIGWSSRDVVVVSAYPLEQGPIVNDENRPRYAMAFNDVQRELRSMPEVVSVGYLSPIPFTAEAIARSGVPIPTLKTLPPDGSRSIPEDNPAFFYGLAGPDGFDILGIPLVLGRSFTEADVANRIVPMMGKEFYGKIGGVGIINQAMAERFWPGENPIGKIYYENNFIGFEVVGVVGNYHQTPGSNDFAPWIFRPYPGTSSIYQLLVKLRPGTNLKNFRENVQQRLSGLTVLSTEFDVRTLSDHTKEVMANRRLAVQLLGAFAVLGIIVSGLGVYANAALMTESRRHETGIRIAMGAQTWDIIRLALWRGARAILIGIPLGLLWAWVLSKMLSSYLVQVYTGEPLIWLISCVLPAGMALIAALIPALRASRVNPLDALKNE